MSVYVRNRRCPCARCRAHGLIGAAILVTLGVLFLLDTNGIVWFRQSWPVLLLVIGASIFFSRTASTENHIQPYVAPAPVIVASAPPTTWTAGTPPPPPPAPTGENNSQVKP
jgi:cell wall-active antibiotic response 4TMS protein YvqF